MQASLITYAKILLFALKNRKTRKFFDLQWQRTANKWNRKRLEEYLELSIEPEEAFSRFFSEKELDPKIFSKLENHIDQFIKLKSKEKSFTKENPYRVNFGLNTPFCRMLFSFCFFTNVDVVIETGVANGFSSSYILLALDLLKKGELYSFDDLILPWHSKEKVGMAIPNNLKHRMNLIFSNAVEELPTLLIKIKEIDIFYHDSLNRYENMKKELEVVWPSIKKGGFVICNDVSQHDAFLDFADEVRRKPVIVQKENSQHMGILQK